MKKIDTLLKKNKNLNSNLIYVKKNFEDLLQKEIDNIIETEIFERQRHFTLTEIDEEKFSNKFQNKSDKINNSKTFDSENELRLVRLENKLLCEKLQQLQRENERF